MEYDISEIDEEDRVELQAKLSGNRCAAPPSKGCLKKLVTNGKLKRLANPIGESPGPLRVIKCCRCNGESYNLSLDRV